MQRKNWTEEQIISLLRQAEQGDSTIAELCRAQPGAAGRRVFLRTPFTSGARSMARCRSMQVNAGQCRSMQVNEAKRLRELEAENTRLKRMVAEQALDIAALKDVLSKKW